MVTPVHLQCRYHSLALSHHHIITTPLPILADGCLNIKMISYQCRDPNYKDKTVSRLCYCYNRIPIPAKTVFILNQAREDYPTWDSADIGENVMALDVSTETWDVFPESNRNLTRSRQVYILQCIWRGSRWPGTFKAPSQDNHCLISQTHLSWIPFQWSLSLWRVKAKAIY